jgi:hypothetical protein
MLFPYPADADVDMAGDIQIERPWDDQLQYLFKVSRKTFAIGASFNIKVIFMPLAKVRMYKFAVDIEGKQLLCVAQLLSETDLISRAY